MGIVHERPGWWIEPGGPNGSDAVATGSEGVATGAAMATEPSSMVVVTAHIRPMGQRSTFTTRPMAYACLNCGEWIHPGTGAWFDPDLDETVCARCWPETVTAVPQPPR